MYWKNNIFKGLSFCVFLVWAKLILAQEIPCIQKHVDSRRLLGTLLHLEVCYSEEQWSDLQKATGRVWQRMEEINKRMNPYDKRSDINLINEAGGSFVRVHEDVYALLQSSVNFFKLTEGSFDVTIAPLSALWRRAMKEQRMPSKREIQAVSVNMNPEGIDLSADYNVRLTRQGMAIDLSGNAQGYAADEAARILKEAGLVRFLMDTGGELVASGMNCEGRDWQIGVKDPLDPDRLMEVVELQDAAVSTSGSYEKFFELNGERFSHIIDPATGYPAVDVISATVIAPTAIEADVFSTALCVLGSGRGLDLIDRLGDGYAAAVYSKGLQGGLERAATSSYEKLLNVDKE